MPAYEVTIGIPVYNVEKYIRIVMDSALAQTFGSATASEQGNR